MLISHKFKLIFIHIPKNAGTFIYELLKKYDNNLLVIINNDSSRNTHHNKASQIKEKCNFDYSDYLIFCIIRNPIDRLVSLYTYIKGNSDYPTHHIVKNQTINEFIEYKFSKRDFLETNYINQYQFIFDDNGNMLIDKIIRYENLEKEIREMFAQKRIYNVCFAKINKSSGTKISRDKVPLSYFDKYIPDIRKEMILFDY